MPDFTHLDRLTRETLAKAFPDLEKAIMDDTSEIGRRRQAMFGDRWSKPYTPPKSWATPDRYSPHSYDDNDADNVMGRHGLPGSDYHDGTDPELGVAGASRDQFNDAYAGADVPMKDPDAANRFSEALKNAGIEEAGGEGNIHHFTVPHPDVNGNAADTKYTASSLSGRVWRAGGLGQTDFDPDNEAELTHVGTVKPGSEHEVFDQLKAARRIP